MGKLGKLIGHWLTLTLDSAYCNALLLAHWWPVHQKPSHVSSAQFSYVALLAPLHILSRLHSLQCPTELHKMP